MTECDIYGPVHKCYMYRDPRYMPENDLWLDKKPEPVRPWLFSMLVVKTTATGFWLAAYPEQPQKEWRFMKRGARASLYKPSKEIAQQSYRIRLDRRIGYTESRLKDLYHIKAYLEFYDATRGFE